MYSFVPNCKGGGEGSLGRKILKIRFIHISGLKFDGKPKSIRSTKKLIF